MHDDNNWWRAGLAELESKSEAEWHRAGLRAIGETDLIGDSIEGLVSELQSIADRGEALMAN